MKQSVTPGTKNSRKLNAYQRDRLRINALWPVASAEFLDFHRKILTDSEESPGIFIVASIGGVENLESARTRTARSE